ncbi:Gastric triacylglycerol lipase [Hondaea fermentalgiana]|uniref:GPI inositol-deacylase n=1 Tax=Hondaea fermentalgiana TaxID=2315210 RepID=A0A2R5GHV6_9STRA|nr:Gastric triacylglycerol lipase [Hondaea fermentalgiana]|eukprot:GBG30470.1 Gastric triacylglycerol lipase [Hondaea fermentalgiana]
MRCRAWVGSGATAALAVLVGCAIRGTWNEPSFDTCKFVEREWSDDDVPVVCDLHPTVTEDGFVLELRHLRQKTDSQEWRGPVLLVHGLADSSFTFVLSGSRDSLVGYLLRNMYEVWLLDKRGRSPYGHQHFNASSQEYWDRISLDEQVDYDLPAAVAQVRRIAGRPLRAIIGHSQGGLVSALALASQPETARSVEHLVVLGSPLALWGGRFLVPRLPDALITVSPVAFFRAARAIASGFCSSRFTARLCAFLLCAAAGCGDPYAFAPEVIARVFAYYPREASFKNMIHLSDSDARGGLFRYGQDASHTLETLQTPTALFYGKFDALLSPDAHQASERALPSQVVKMSDGSLPYGHAGYIWSTTAKDLLYPSVLDFVETDYTRTVDD